MTGISPLYLLHICTTISLSYWFSLIDKCLLSVVDSLALAPALCVGPRHTTHQPPCSPSTECWLSTHPSSSTHQSLVRAGHVRLLRTPTHWPHVWNSTAPTWWISRSRPATTGTIESRSQGRTHTHHHTTPWPPNTWPAACNSSAKNWLSTLNTHKKTNDQSLTNASALVM